MPGIGHHGLVPMETPALFVVGASHLTASIAFREQLTLGLEDQAALWVALRQIEGLREIVVLATCNRVEIYGVADSREAPVEVASAFCRVRGVDLARFGQAGFMREGADVVQHLLEVVSGLDSQIVGETEILGQAKRAYAGAQARMGTGPVLNRLFQKAFHTAKLVRTQTSIGSGQVSVAGVAADLVLEHFPSIADVRILLLGAGEMAQKCARMFHGRGARRLTVSNRCALRAEALAREFDANTLPFAAREAELARFDLVVSSTAAPGTVISTAAVQAAMMKRPDLPLMLIDLAMPRDVEAGVGTIRNVTVHNLDDLAASAAGHRLAREDEAHTVRTLLAPRCAALWDIVRLQSVTAAGALACA
jgi:glutamyl-tRNA reductase